MKIATAAVLALSMSPAIAQEPAPVPAWDSATCTAALEHAYRSFAARPGASTEGDYNGDGRADVALLLDNPVAGRSAIGVCLSRESRPLLVTAPYQDAKIFTKPKGTAYTDFEAARNGVYELDAISVSDGAWIGASYVLRAGVFERIVDTD